MPLTGALEQYSEQLLQQNAKISLLTPIIEKIEQIVPGLQGGRKKQAMLALYYMYARASRGSLERLDSARVNAFLVEHAVEFEQLSMENVVLHLFSTCWVLPFDPAGLETMREEYFRTKYMKGELNVGKLFESALGLALAERHRRMGNEQRSRELVKEVVEGWPDNSALRALENAIELKPLPILNWHSILLPHITV